jgi:N-acetyl-anhydromuramyl-L-alanine amidase AmpD
MRLRKWLHVHVLIVAVVAVTVAYALGAFSGPAVRVIFGHRLNPQGQRVYRAAASGKLEQGQRVENETLPASEVAKLRATNQATAVGQTGERTAAAREAVTATSFVRNFSGRNGARPALLVVHDTESPNASGLQDVSAIAAWFNNPAAQASSNYTTDADGNTLELVPEAEKAWAQAFFNPWSISDELIGYASQRAWPEPQLRAAAQLFAAAAIRWGIPVQHGAVSGCRIVRPGILQHADLGACGGGHHDAGAAFPIGRFIRLVGEYVAALTPHPKPKPKPTVATPRPVPAWAWRWAQWRLGHGPCCKGHPNAPTYRPQSAPRRIPAWAWRWLRRFTP